MNERKIPMNDNDVAEHMNRHYVMCRLRDLKSTFEQTIPVDLDDQESLYRLVRTERPALILELGGGFSTYTIASALQMNGRGMVVSVDDSHVWQRNTQSYFKAYPDLARRVHFVQSALVPWSSEYEWGDHIEYEKDLALPYDMVYIDGPDIEGKTYSITGNAHKYIREQDLVVAIDGRQECRAYYLSMLPDTIIESRDEFISMKFKGWYGEY